MRWELTEEQGLFQDAFQAWLTKQCSSDAARHWQDSRDPQSFEQSLVAEAWLGVGTSEELGGQGGGLIELALAAEALARVGAPSSAWLATVLAVPAFVGAADLGRAAMGQGEFAALAVPADTPPDASPTVAYDEGRLRGEIAGVLGADRARHVVVPVDIEGTVRLALADTGIDGTKVKPRRLLDRSRSVADLEFDGAPATVLDIDGGAVLEAAALRAAVLIAADALGAMDRMMSMAVDYSKQRQQFGVPIGSFQAVKHAAATMLVGVEAARSITYFAAASVDQQHPDRALHAAAAKAQVTAEAKRAADSALTLHGAIGYTWEYDLHLFYKRAMLDAALFGSAENWNERIASALPLTPAG
jgi:alkylation response protein AidB-like acyl-CoA dehydrogenase